MKLITREEIAEAEKIYPTLGYVKLWYKLYEIKGWISPIGIMILSFFVFGIAAIIVERYSLILRNLMLVLCLSPLAVVFISGIIAISLKNINIRKRASWLGIAVKDYNKYIL